MAFNPMMPAPGGMMPGGVARPQGPMPMQAPQLNPMAQRPAMPLNAAPQGTAGYQAAAARFPQMPMGQRPMMPQQQLPPAAMGQRPAMPTQGWMGNAGTSGWTPGAGRPPWAQAPAGYPPQGMPRPMPQGFQQRPMGYPPQRPMMPQPMPQQRPMGYPPQGFQPRPMMPPQGAPMQRSTPNPLLNPNFQQAVAQNRLRTVLGI